MQKTMSIKTSTNMFRKSQAGATLIVSLVLLSLITLFGVATMQSSNLQLKMAASAKERNLLFAAAEAAIAEAEAYLSEERPGYDRLASGCSLGDECFTLDCSGGFCFDGNFEPSMKKSQCQVANLASSTERQNFWEDESLWTDTDKHIVYNTSLDDLGLDNQVKYIIEFLCYVDSGESTVTSFESGDESLGVPLYRITSKADADSGKSRVMLQATYVIN